MVLLASIHTIKLFDVSPPDGPFIASSKKNGPFSETWFAFAETISPLMFGPNITGKQGTYVDLGRQSYSGALSAESSGLLFSGGLDTSQGDSMA